MAKLYASWITVNYREAYGLYACNGILFNHESSRRAENFVTCKITRGLANIAQGLKDCFYLGNLDALRDWGHAKYYVEMQWLMLQQDSPEVLVIATSRQYSLRQFILWAAEKLGITLQFRGQEIDQHAVVESISDEHAPALQPGQTIIRVDPKYFRPTEVETLLGDYSKARNKLGWIPKISTRDMCREMVAHDLEQAKRQALLRRHGYHESIGTE